MLVEFGKTRVLCAASVTQGVPRWRLKGSWAGATGYPQFMPSVALRLRADGLISEETPLSTNQRSCFWGGWGGSIVVNDLDARLTVSYVMNRMDLGLAGTI